MSVTTWCRVFVLLSLLTLPDFVASPPVHSQSSGGAGSGGSIPGGSQGTSTNPRGPKTGSPGKPNMLPSEKSKQTEGHRAPAQVLEERLRSGQMEHPIAQDQISNRLEQLHEGSTEGAPTGTATEPSTK